MKKTLLLLLSCAFILNITAQIAPKGPPISIDQATYTIEQLIEEVLINGCVDAYNISYSTDATAFAYFDQNGSVFPFESGILMVTGPAAMAVGPNDESSAGTDNSLGSDPQLEAIASNSVHNATILEFDFIPSSDTILFEYIFGSEEYNEYANTSYNDVFGFFLSGGPEGYSNVNIALIPGTTTPVAINNVNWGNSYSPIVTPLGDAVNPAYYFENSGGEAVEFDGHTVPLVAMAVVTPCEEYHIKLAVGDCGDGVFDSGVFLKEGSFTDGGEISMHHPTPAYGAYDQLFEGCESYYVFSRLDSSASALLDSVEIVLSYDGSATMGADYSNLPSSVWIPIGQMSDTIFFETFEEGTVEPIETIIINLLSGCPCSMSATSDTIYINDYIVFKAGVSPNNLQYCDGAAPDSIMIEAYSDSHDSDFLYYQWSNGVVGPEDSIVWVHPSPGYNVYYATISDLCENSVTDSCVIIISDLTGSEVDYTSGALCNDECVGTMDVTAAGVSPPFILEWNFFPAGTPAVDYSMTDLCPGFYGLKIIDNYGCFKQFTFIIEDPDEIELEEEEVYDDYFGCSGEYNPTFIGGTLPYTYTWYNITSATNGAGLTGLCYGTYNLTLTDANGCTFTTVFQIDNMTSIGEFEDSKIKVYPNPSNTGNFFIEFDQGYNELEIELIDVSGKMILNELIEQNSNIYNLNGISKGVYLLRLRSGDDLILRKRIVVTDK